MDPQNKVDVSPGNAPSTPTVAEPSRGAQIKQWVEFVSILNLANSAIKAVNDIPNGKSIDDFLYHIGNTAFAILAATIMVLGIALWASFFGMSKLIERIPDSLFATVCFLLGIYWSLHGFKTDPTGGFWVGAVAVVFAVYSIYERLAALPKTLK